ncbi:MAG: hypothetical protein K0Q52_2838 [Microbacterium sp.]|nr:hypothetical protein [Microbacterium sp.]
MPENSRLAEAPHPRRALILTDAFLQNKTVSRTSPAHRAHRNRVVSSLPERMPMTDGQVSRYAQPSSE